MLCNLIVHFVSRKKTITISHLPLFAKKTRRFTEPKTYRTPTPFGSNYNNYPLLKEIIAVMKMNSNQIFKPYSMFNDGLSCLFNDYKHLRYQDTKQNGVNNCTGSLGT